MTALILVFFFSQMFHDHLNHNVLLCSKVFNDDLNLSVILFKNVS
jgi:hypothetical protein